MVLSASIYADVLTALMRYLAPIFAFVILLRCVKPMLFFRREPEVWGWLYTEEEKRISITHWETVIGSSKRSDICIPDEKVEKTHAVLTRYDDGSWTIVTVGDAKMKVNGRKTEVFALQPNDEITLGETKLLFAPISALQEQHLSKLRTKASSLSYSFFNLLLMTVFQLLCALSYTLNGPSGTALSVLMGFGGIIVCQWLMLIFYFAIRRSAFEIETIAFFLCTMGMCAISAVCPEEAVKQLVSMILGIVAFFAIGWSLRDLERAKVIRHIAAVAGVLFLIVTLLFGKEYYGAKNWLTIGSLSIQPSELSKVCFVYAGASAMDRLMDKKNIVSFIVYSVLICLCLALMNDFGTALIFFVAFLVIAFLRSGSVGTVALACTSLGFAGVVLLKIAPHALRRFATWRHIWENPLTGGYQQTRALMCMASGGMLGLGAGNGWMKKVFAADSDMVIATIGEEWGLLMVIALILSIVSLAVFAVRSASVGRSSFYVIGGVTAAAILVFQATLNALGTVDILPLTGVTFPFVSNGGSSMICVWGLLAFIKAGDTRQNGSFAVPLLKKRREKDE